MQPSQFDDASLACSIVAPAISSPTTARPGITEQQIKHPCRIDRGMIAGRDRAAQAWRDVLVEADFALVKAQSRPGLPLIGSLAATFNTTDSGRSVAAFGSASASCTSV